MTTIHIHHEQHGDIGTVQPYQVQGNIITVKDYTGYVRLLITDVESLNDSIVYTVKDTSNIAVLGYCTKEMFDEASRLFEPTAADELGIYQNTEEAA